MLTGHAPRDTGDLEHLVGADDLHLPMPFLPEVAPAGQWRSRGNPDLMPLAL